MHSCNDQGAKTGNGIPTTKRYHTPPAGSELDLNPKHWPSHLTGFAQIAAISCDLPLQQSH